MTTSPTVERDTQQPSALSPPHPHLARYLAEGESLLDDELLCVCGHLEGDHRVLDDHCSRCQRCVGFLATPEDEETAPLAVVGNDDAAYDLDTRREREVG